MTRELKIGSMTLVGQDVFRGRPAKVEMEWNPDRTEGSLRWGAQLARLNRSEFRKFQPEAARQTILTCDRFPGQVLMHSEHAFAAWLFFANLPIELNVHSDSFPLLDGSALPWREAFSKLAVEFGGASHAPVEWECRVGHRREWKNGFLYAEPASHFSVTYTVERDEFISSYHLESAAEAYDEILPARTFIFADDLARIWNPNSGSHVHPDSGILLAGSREETERAMRRWNLKVDAQEQDWDRLLHPQTFRFSDEPARHKILDLMGDLALGNLGLPKLRIHAKNAGHDTHHELIKNIQSETKVGFSEVKK